MEEIKKITNLLLGNIFFNIKEYNKPNIKDNKYILCPNHISEFDGPIMWMKNDIKIMAKKECFEKPIIGTVLENAGVISVDRTTSGLSTIKEAIKYINSGENNSFMLFPQGTISDINKNALTRIKDGAFYLANKTNTEIIPIFIEQPRIFRKSRIMYGDPIKIETPNGKLDKETLLYYRKLWQEEIFKLEEEALKVENRSFRKLKLNYKHSNNNN